MAINPISFTNTPQAKDDLLLSSNTKLNEDSKDTFELDVMKNDLGGNAKTLYSLDNGLEDDGIAGADLLIADGGNKDKSLNGATIWIDGGKVKYKANTWNDNFKQDLQHLAAGESLTDSFTYAIRLGNGTLSWATATVQIAGKNDDVTIVLAETVSAGAVKEDTIQTATGNITFRDIDLSDTHMATFVKLGALDEDHDEDHDDHDDDHDDHDEDHDHEASGDQHSPWGNFALAPVSEAANAEKGSVAWTYTLNNAAAQSLAKGEVITEVYVVKIDDGHGSTATQNVTITITGTNDEVLVSGAVASGAVVEDVAASASATGTVGFTDVDLNDVHTLTSALKSSDYGTAMGGFSVVKTNDTTGTGLGGVATWTYTLDNSAAQRLAKDQVATEVHTITINDNNGDTVTQDVTITITGTNDEVLVSGAVASGAVVEDVAASASATGTVNFTDVDLTDVHTVISTLKSSDYGTAMGGFSVVKTTDTTGTGLGGVATWTYTLDNSAAQRLAEGQVVTEVHTITIDDNNGDTVTQDVTITISGTNDAPIVSTTDLTGAVTELVTPAGNLTDSGTLSFSDVDLTDAHSIGAVIPSAGALGSLTANVTADTTGSGLGGVVTWDYSVDAAAVEYLAAGQTKNETFTFNVLDGNGGSVSRTTSVTITGSNDAPVIALADTSGTVTAKPTVASASKMFTVQQYLGFQSNDPAALRNYAATHTANYTVQTDVIDYTDYPSGQSGDYSVNQRWPAAEAGNYNGYQGVNDNFFSRITANLSVLTADTYTFRTYNDDGVFLMIDNNLIISDTGYHGADRREGSITLTPGNHSLELFFYENGGAASLELSVRNSTGSFGLLGASGGGLGVVDQVVDNGSIAFDDADLTDGHLVSVVPDGTTVGSLTAVKANDTTGTGTGGKVDWTYMADNSKLVALAEGETKFDRFNITIDDQHGGTVTKQVEVSVIGVNDAPVAVADAAAGTENQTLTIDVLGNDTDVDNNHVFTLNTGSAPVNKGSVSVVDNKLVFNPGSDFDRLAQGVAETVTLSYEMQDEYGAKSTSTVSVTVTGANDAPVASNDINALTVTTVASQNHDNTVHWVDWTSATGGGNGAAGTIYGTIDLGNGQTVGVTYTGEYYFAQTNGGTNFYTGPAGTYTSAAVANGPGGSSDIIALSQQTQKTLTFSQPVDNLFFAVVSLNGMANGVNNGYLFDHDFNIVSSGPGFFGQGAATKVALPDGRYELLSTYNSTPTLREFHGVVQIDGTVQSLTWTSLAAETWNGFTIGTYGKSLTATASGNVLTNDSDPESDPLTVTALNGNQIVGNSTTLKLASGAEVTMNRDGSYLYDEKGAFASLGQGATATDSFSYTVSDGHGGTATATASITVAGVNDAPTGKATSVLANGTEDTPYIVSASNLLTGFSDVDSGDILSIASLAASNGTVIDNLDGTFTITPTANFNGVVNLNYNVIDGNGGSVPSTQSYSLAAVNDIAVITGKSSGDVTEDVAPYSVNGNLVVTDVDAGEAIFSLQSSLSGIYGDFNFDSLTGAWAYTLRNGAANVQALNTGEQVTDILKIASFDGTAQKDIVINIAGSNDTIDVIGTKVLDFSNISGQVGVYQGFDFTSFNSPYNSYADWYSYGDGVVFNGWAGKYSHMTAANGSDFSVDKLDIKNWSYVNQVDIKGFNNGVEKYTKTVALSGSMQTVDLNFANIDDLEIVVTNGSYSDSGWWYVDNIWVA